MSSSPAWPTKQAERDLVSKKKLRKEEEKEGGSEGGREKGRKEGWNNYTEYNLDYLSPKPRKRQHVL